MIVRNVERRDEALIKTERVRCRAYADGRIERLMGEGEAANWVVISDRFFSGPVPDLTVRDYARITLLMKSPKQTGSSPFFFVAF